MSRGVKIISKGERYENDTRTSIFDERDRIELDYVDTYSLDCATPPDSEVKDVEIRNNLAVKLEIPKTDFNNPSVQNILKWANLPLQNDDYYRDLAVSLQMAGNKPIALVGGGTGMIGDPSGRTDLRNMMTVETIEHNCDCFKRQMSKFIDFSEGKALMVNNAQ